MQYEGMHGFFTMKKFRNFRNLLYSVAKHHQLNMCYKQAGPFGDLAINFLYDGDTVDKGDVISLDEMNRALHAQICELTRTEVCEVYIAPSASIHRLQY